MKRKHNQAYDVNSKKKKKVDKKHPWWWEDASKVSERLGFHDTLPSTKQAVSWTTIYAFDPGIKTFQTGFDSNSKGDFKRLFRLTLQIDKLTSKVDTHHKENYSPQKEYRKYKRQRRKMRRTIGYLRRKMMNLKKDFHWKIARHITLNNKHIMISRFQVSNMVNKLTRNINSKTRCLLNWSHFDFRQRLKHQGLIVAAKVIKFRKIFLHC